MEWEKGGEKDDPALIWKERESMFGSSAVLEIRFGLTFCPNHLGITVLERLLFVLTTSYDHPLFSSSSPF